MQRRDFVKALGVGAAVNLVSARSVRSYEPLKQSNSRVIVDGLSPSALDVHYLDMLKQAGVSIWHKSLFGLESFADTWQFVDSQAPRVSVVQKSADLEDSIKNARLGLILGWQTASILGDRSGQEMFAGVYNPKGATGLRAWYQMGLRVVNLTYNTTNAFAAGCLEPEIGLTRAGRRLVEEVHKLGILLDVGGHTGKQSSLDALAMSKGVPVICSHTNVAALCQNPRNTSDEVFEKIAATGGVIGISAINDFVARCAKDKNTPSVPQGDLSVLLNHFDYLKKLVGVDHIGLGPDFTYGSQGGVNPDNVLFGREMASEQTPIAYVKGFEKITEIGNLEAGLAARGWTSSEIDQVFGLNWLRVYRQVW